MATPTISLAGHQWLRSAKLIVAQKAQSPEDIYTTGLDLSALHFRFVVRSADVESPDTLVVRVYNLDDQTQQSIIDEYDQVTLQVGYVNTSTSAIFTGTIKRFVKGRENNTDTFLEITAADSDIGYVFGFVNTTLAAGSTMVSLVEQLANSMNVSVDQESLQFASTGGILPRGRVAFGLARVHMTEIADSMGASWSIQSGVLYLTPITAYRAGTAIQLGPTTGLVGVPEATDGGINARCLLNPNLRIGERVQIPYNLINTTKVLSYTYPDSSPTATVTKEGIYRILTLDHSGDTRGQDWYSEIVALAVDPSSPVDESVAAFS